MALKALFDDIAAAIREKEGSEAPIVANTFPERIRAIETSPKLNQAQTVEVVAEDQIRVGDTVYTVEGELPYLQAETRDIPFSTVTFYAAAFSPDGKTLVLGGNFTGGAKVYSVEGTAVTYVGDIYADNNGTALNSSVSAAAFSPDGKTLVLGGNFSGRAKLYSVEGASVTYVSDIYADNNGTALNNPVSAAAFSPDGKTLVLGGNFTGGAKVYSVEGTTVTYVSDIYADNNGAALSSGVYTTTFSPDGKTLVLGGYFAGFAKVYAVEGATVTYVSDIYADNAATVLGGGVYTTTFSPDGKALVLGGDFSGRAKLYSVEGTAVTYVSNLYADTESTALTATARKAAFLPDGKTLMLAGDFSGRAKLYSVEGTTVTYVSDIYADGNATALRDTINMLSVSPVGNLLVMEADKNAGIYHVEGERISYLGNAPSGYTTELSGGISGGNISPDGKILVLNGSFTGYAKVYAVEGAIATYVSDIYADNNGTALNSSVSAAAFSPDGKALVLIGSFDGYAKVYTVEGASVTYVSDIYADSAAAALDRKANAAAFSPDGKVLVLIGGFAGFAKVYAVEGTAVTYVSDIYADNAAAVLNKTATAAAFSPDGKALVLVGGFAGFAKVYAVEGTAVTYVSDIYADDTAAALNRAATAATFSPDGKVLVLIGSFAGFAKVYAVEGASVTYVSNICADNAAAALNRAPAAAAFSPDGKALVLIGGFVGFAKVYAVEETSVTYVSNICADNNGTALNISVSAAAFSPDGKTLVLGGNFSGRAKIYSVEGTAVTYVSNIYADNKGTALNNFVSTAAFSPDGKTLVLGGNFAGRGKIYPVAGGEITYGLTLANGALDGSIPAGSAPCGVGWALEDVAPGGTGRVTLIATVKEEATT